MNIHGSEKVCEKYVLNICTVIIGEAAITSETQQHTGIIFLCALQKVFFKSWILTMQVKINERDTFELMQAL